jgi:hypothetical protein
VNRPGGIPSRHVNVEPLTGREKFAAPFSFEARLVALDQTIIEDAIESNIVQPKRVKFGQREVEQHSIGDQLKAREAAASDAASTQPHRGIRLTKLISPGTG